LAGCTEFTDNSIGLLVHNARYLLELDLTGCTSITGSFIQYMPRTNSLSHRSSSDSLYYGKTFPALRELRIGGCTSLDLPVFISNFALSDWLSLRILDLTQCQRLQDTDLMTIIAHAPRIRNLVLYKCIGLTDYGIQCLIALGKYLHYLHLGHCLEVTDMAIVQLARNCTRLRYLDLASCVRITDISCMELGASLERLKRIGLVKCTGITDRGIVALVRGRAQICNVLERIHLSYCLRLTLDVIPFVEVTANILVCYELYSLLSAFNSYQSFGDSSVYDSSGSEFKKNRSRRFHSRTTSFVCCIFRKWSSET
jgi:F-box and leucine-rich repeat protein GRR1